MILQRDHALFLEVFQLREVHEAWSGVWSYTKNRIMHNCVCVLERVREKEKKRERERDDNMT